MPREQGQPILGLRLGEEADTTRKQRQVHGDQRGQNQNSDGTLRPQFHPPEVGHGELRQVQTEIGNFSVVTSQKYGPIFKLE